MIEYSAEFEVAWTVYQSPKNSSKKKAYESYLKLNGSKPPTNLFIAEISCYNKWLETEVKKTGRDYPKCHMATWINQRRFESFEDDARRLLEAQEARSKPVGSGDAWDKRFDALEPAVGHDAFCHWFLATTISQTNGTTWIDCPSKFHRDYLDRKFGDVLKNTFGDVKLTVSAKKKAT